MTTAEATNSGDCTCGRRRSRKKTLLGMGLLGAAVIVIPAVVMVLPGSQSDIKSDETVVFYPTYAHLDADGKTWTVPVHGVIYEPEEDSTRRGLLVEAIRATLAVDADTDEGKILQRRIRLFLVDNERGKDISIRLDGQTYEAGTSAANGHFSRTLQLPATAEAGWLVFEAITRRNDERRFAGRVQLIAPQGLSIISDVDDTIKHTQVRDHEAMLRNTFLREFKPVPGMAELYRDCAARGIVFHYVSGSPWQLYPALATLFGPDGYPLGSFHLKYFRLTDASALNLLLSQEKTKTEAIEPILAAFPQRRFIMIGDSGEQDPEIYGTIARKHPKQIVAVCIRNVTAEKPDNERFRNAFKGFGDTRSILFEQADELRLLLDELQEPVK
ncbi:MAG: App1 family protein [Candidatus Nealsonbacteria bacterium]|nr:App1 family protein [Candidatus Nealsonbacteria bacterium]